MWTRPPQAQAWRDPQAQAQAQAQARVVCLQQMQLPWCLDSWEQQAEPSYSVLPPSVSGTVAQAQVLVLVQAQAQARARAQARAQAQIQAQAQA
jgi:hypothetical protein